MSFDMDRINTGIGTSLNSLGSDIATKTAGTNNGALSEVELLQLQQSMQKWSIMVNMQTNMQKTWSDALKAIVSNLR